MKRNLEVIDILVAIGMVATLLGGYLLFMASYGGAFAVATPNTPVNNPPIQLMLQSMLQPSMGQAIVGQAMLEDQFASDVIRGSSKLYKATLAAGHHPIGGLDTIETRAAKFEADHAGRVQFVMGRTIVNLTSQGMRAGVISADNLSNRFNERLIATAKSLGDLLESQFAKNWQARLGHWIVEAGKRENRYAGHIQERIGQATVGLATTQNDYLTKRTEHQIQFNALVTASARTDAQSYPLARLVGADMNLQRALGVTSMPEIEIVEAGTLPEVPFGYLIAAFSALIVIFIAGFMFPSGHRETEAKDMITRIEQLRHEIYRKTG